MRPIPVGPGWDWTMWAAGGLSICCSAILGLAVTNEASVEWRDGLMGFLGLALAGLGACEVDVAPEDTPWHAYDGAFRGG